MNKSRSEHLEYILCEKGFTPASTPDEAEVVIFNTCAVREHAMDKAVSIVNSWASRRGKDAMPLLVIFGCLSQHMKEAMKKKIPGIDVMAGTHNLEDIPRLVFDRIEEKKGQFAIPEGETGPLLEKGYRRKHGITALLPITYGCDNYCSYCIVPYTTGRQRSKITAQVLQEIENIIDEGFREIILLGQNVNSYGKDLPGDQDFETLLTDIAKMVDGKNIWIRFLTSHPKDMRKHIVEIVRDHSCICPYFHFPLQAGSDRILSLMNRGYDQHRYLEMADLIRREIPYAGIGTDIIVGYPSETEADFLETLHVVKKVAFDVAYTFMYSPRPGTQAEKMEDDVLPAEKKERLTRINQLVREVRMERLRNLMGRECVALVEREKEGLVGKTASNLKVDISGTNSLREGEWRKVRFISLRGSRVIAQVIDET